MTLLLADTWEIGWRRTIRVMPNQASGAPSDAGRDQVKGDRLGIIPDSA
jgi:hypothetical protein